MGLAFLILIVLRMTVATKPTREVLERINVNQKLILHCQIKMAPTSGLLQWLYAQKGSSSFKLICMKKQDEIDCIKNNNTEPWMENLQILKNGVEIEKVTQRHRGVYRCRYMDTSNLEAYDIEVDVLTPPEKPIIHTSQMTFVADKVVTLTCTTKGSNPKASLKWIWKDFSNKPIKQSYILNQSLQHSDSIYGQTTLTITWRPQSSDDHKSIGCVAENPLATVTSNWMYLNINYPPMIYDLPESPYYVLLGSEVNIECKAIGKTTTTFQWLSEKDETLAETAQLIIKSVSKIHKGSYRCSVTNPYGTSSARVNITVLSSPLIELEKSQVVIEGEVWTSKCKVTPSSANVSWWMDSKCISTSREVQIALNGIKPVEVECRATVPMITFPGHLELASSSQSVNVTIHYKPRKPIIAVHPFVLPTLGMDLTITCVPDTSEPGVPRPDYLWHRYNTRWTKNNTNFLSFSSLTFNDSGVYVCTLYNTIGRSFEASYNLVIYGQPQLSDTSLQSPTIVQVKENQPFSVVCHYQGYPLPEITWLCDDILIQQNLSEYRLKEKQTSFNGFKSVLEVERLSTQSCEVYRCQATNKYGSSHHEFNVQIKYSPRQMSDVFIVAVNSSGHTPSGEPVHLNCSIFGSQEVVVLWFRRLSNNNEHSIKNSTDHYYIKERLRNRVVESILFIRNFENEDYGRYFCTAKYSEGPLDTEYQIRRLSIPDPSHDLVLYKQSWNSLSFKWIPGFDGGYPQTFLVSYVTDLQKIPTQTRKDEPNVTITNLLPDTFYTVTVSSCNTLGTTQSTLSVKVKTEALYLGDEKVIIINKEDQTLELTLPLNLSSRMFCLKIEELESTQDSSNEWKLLRSCIKDVYHRISIERPASRFRARICLSSIPDVCTGPIANSIVSESAENILSTKLIGTVAASCTVLVILLAILLFFILLRTRRLLPGISDLKDINIKRKSSRNEITNYISKPMSMICPNKDMMLIDSGGCPLLSTYSCDPVHLSNSPIDVFNVCSTHNIFNEGLYSTLVKSNSISLFPNDTNSPYMLNNSHFINEQRCCCHNDQQVFNLPQNTNPENLSNGEKIFYEVMV